MDYRFDTGRIYDEVLDYLRTDNSLLHYSKEADYYDWYSEVCDICGVEPEQYED